MPTAELEKLKALKDQLALGIDLNLDAGKGEKKEASAGDIDANSILQALVKLLLDALTGAAGAEGTPVGVTA